MSFGALNILFFAMLSLILPAHARPLYTDGSNKTLALVLCGNLHDAVLALKQREVLEHAIGADWLEENCVSIDPCAQRSSNEDPIFGLPLPALAGVWISGNSSALRLPRAAAAILAAEAGLRAENSRSLEFARVPEGLRVETCAPDFDLFRREGRLRCNENTVVVINTESDTRACPGTLPHTLLDCVKPLQFDAGIETLVWRAPGEKMHFGTATWNDACSAEAPLPALVREMCTLLSEYTLQLPVAAAIGSTSLVRYDFLPGYACHDELPQQQGGGRKCRSCQQWFPRTEFLHAQMSQTAPHSEAIFTRAQHCVMRGMRCSVVPVCLYVQGSKSRAQVATLQQQSASRAL